MIESKTIQQLNKEKKNILYNLEDTEFIEVYNNLLINQFDKTIIKENLPSNINTDVEDYKKLNEEFDKFIYDILKDMPESLSNKTSVTYKVDIRKFEKHRLLKYIDCINENYNIMQQKEAIYNLALNFFIIMESLSTLQHILIIDPEFIDKDDNLKSKFILNFSEIDSYLEFFEDPKYEGKIKMVLNEARVKLIKLYIKKHKNLLKNLPEYKKLYEQKIIRKIENEGYYND